MKITLFTQGSRGDVQPFLALAVGLQQAGHCATLVAPTSFTAWIQAYGVGVHPIPFDAQAFMQQPETQAMLKSGNMFRLLRFVREVQAQAAGLFDILGQAAEAADFVVAYSGMGAVELASQRGIPVAFAAGAPLPPTSAFPSFYLPWRFSLGGRYNRLTHALVLRALWAAFGGPLDLWRATRLSLPPWRSFQAMWAYAHRTFGTPWLMGYSPSVLPKPSDWEDYDHVTGYWFLEAPPDWQPSVELVSFLESGAPPVYVGFGSMSHADPEAQTRLVLRALELSGQRGVLSTGWGSIAPLAPNSSVCYVDEVPFNWLFPRMAAVAHHGGSGTTAAGLRAGVPSLVAPHNFDQFAWANQVAQLGVGLQLPAIKNLTAEKLAQAIHTAVSDVNLRARAAALGERIRAENGIARAVEVIERHATDFHAHVHFI